MQILCVGSPHGDDQVGWLVGDLLRDKGVELVHRIQNVDQLIEYLTPDIPSIIIDACLSGTAVGTQFRFEWPDPRISAGRGLSSHGIDVPYALRLAEVLGKLPQALVVYGIEIRSSHPTQELDSKVISAAHELADQIAGELAADEDCKQCMNDH